MSRGSTTTDMFTAIFGNRRGRPAVDTPKRQSQLGHPFGSGTGEGDLISPKRQPQSGHPFGRQRQTRERRLWTLIWWSKISVTMGLDHTDLLMGVANFLSEKGVNLPSFCGNSLRADVRFFEQKGLCQRLYHHSGVRWRLKPVALWPKAERETFDVFRLQVRG